MNNDIKNDIEITKSESVVIPVRELGINVDLKLQNKVYTVPQLTNEIVENLKSEVATNSIRGEIDKETFEQLKQHTMDVLQSADYTQPQIHKIQGENDSILNIAYEKDGEEYKTYKTVLESKKYNGVQQFANEIINQVPIELRNKDVIIDSTEQAFNDQPSRESPSPPPSPPLPLQSSSPKHKNVVKTQRQSQDSSDMIIVYTDIIKPRYIESMQTRYLRVLPNASNERHIRFCPVEYCQLENNYIQSISILIANRYGEAIVFNESKIPTYVMLHFRKNI